VLTACLCRGEWLGTFSSQVLRQMLFRNVAGTFLFPWLVPAGLEPAYPIFDHRPCEDKLTMSRNQATKGLVLVVDDHPINRLLMDAMLKKAGWSCVLAESAYDAMEILVGGLRPDVIFMDIRMPDVDGFAATKKIRQWELDSSLGHTPIVALSADALEESKCRALSEGMDAYLTKPITLERMSGALEKFAGAVGN